MTTPVWTDDRARDWLRKLDEVENELAPVSEVLFEVAALQPGMDVLDVGCGPGSTTRRASALVGPEGSTTGLDLSPVMIDAARQLAGGAPIRWLVADLMQDGLPAAAYDVVISRFGVMFFPDPVVAFSRLLAATRPGGRLCVAVWRSPGEVPLFDVPYEVVSAVLRSNGVSFDDVISPGTSLGNQSDTSTLLRRAGWTDVAFATSDAPLYPGGPLTLEDAVEVCLTQGPVRMLLSDRPDSLIEQCRSALRERLAPLYDGVGVPLPGGFMIISATRA